MIEVGEYVRTKNGVIAKVENIATYYKDKVYWFDKVIYREYEDGIEHLYDYKLEEYIVNHSKNIIDLIEVGDYVNGHLVVEKYIDIDDNGNDFITIEVESDLMLHKSLVEKHIKSIVTKQQYKNIEYRLE